ncbi:unnamed protein product [Rotaria magnacalcarata]|uniref:N-acetylgalactosamine kinase n=1 Tax=Rotaria magnacalcarata TaxID=392030 RepID=A0A819M1S1_9BILA|nr:unnamed protein product [Rotaria magnacalcarata]
MDTVSIADGIPQNPNQERFKQLVEKFKNVYNGIQPQFLCRAPGRVNLIGEHIDYCGYSVLPMAIDQDIVAVFATSDNNEVEISNTDESFQAGSFTIGKFSISYEKSDWYEYFKCGVQGIHDKFPDFNLKGGMDQAASCLARSGSAMLISFNPLKIQDVTLPVGCAFVVTHSLTELNKAASDHFNIRVSECRLATQILAHAKNLDWRSIRKPYELQIALGLTIIELEKFALDTLHKLPYTLNEIADLLSVTVDELISISLKSNVNREQKFELCNRIKHVLSEANRVLLFKQVCDSNTYDRVEKLGELMNQSHNSCAKLYECSSNELDELTDICRQSGALGSRLTGAGWGGCAVSLVREENLHTFITSVRDKFYINGKDSKRAVKADQSIFPTLPGCGIYVARL